ncbi:hypothetical protein YC2023_111866 [Brassica napus]
MQQHIGLEFADAKVKVDALINISIGGDISFEFCSKFRGTAEYISFNSDQHFLSDQLSHLTKLTNLDLSGHDFDKLPSSIRDLTALVTLCLNNCKKLRSVEKLPLSLQFLDAHGCDSLEEADSVEHFRDKPNKQVQQRT